MSISELFLPGWGVDPALYRNLSPDAELFDYGFFSADSAAMKEPAAGSASGKIILAHSMGTAFALRCAALTLIVIAMARPQSAEHHSRTTAEGIDIGDKFF